ncbi:MAG: hypothetical protein ACOY0R_21825 [Chloroflexota bacterium]|jgi:hypothetical protein
MTRSAIIKRILLSLVLGMSLAALTSEVSYQLLKRENREPMRIELVVPAGTAARVAAGEAPPGLPADMSFVIGDTLVVVNQDEVDHQLGPLWVPAGTSASMTLSSEENFALECSFQPTRYFGLDVRPPVTLGTRLSGVFFAGFPLSALFAVYSILIQSDKKKKEAAA